MSWLSEILKGKTTVRELSELAYFVVRERYLQSIVAAYAEEPALDVLSGEQKRAAASIAVEVVRRKLLGG